jgi:hypothetical protein
MKNKTKKKLLRKLNLLFGLYGLETDQEKIQLLSIGQTDWSKEHKTSCYACKWFSGQNDCIKDPGTNGSGFCSVVGHIWCLLWLDDSCRKDR